MGELGPSSPESPRSAAFNYRRYMLLILMFTVTFNYVDRQVFGLLYEDLRAAFRLTDTQLGLLGGIAFALFYSILGLPIARLADRRNRVTILSVTTLLWGTSVALCGAAASFVHLFLIRMCIGIGEAGCLPTAHSLVADHFSRAERPRAVSTLMLGGPLSAAIAYFCGGWLNELFGWRLTLVLLGVPGFVLAFLIWMTLKEPRIQYGQERTRPRDPDVVSGPGLLSVLGTLYANATFRNLLIALSVASFFTSGVSQWKPAFFMRTYGLGTGELGTWLVFIYGACGLIGTYAGGVLATRYAANDERRQLRFMAILMLMSGLLTAGIYLSPTYYGAFAFMGASKIAGDGVAGPLFATIQTLAPARMRASAIALLYFFVNLIGIGLGPLAAGFLSDALHTADGADSLRLALLLLTPGYLWIAWHMWRGSRTVRRDLAHVLGSETELLSASSSASATAYAR